jgi:signal transduction histidine kinase
MKFLDSRWMKGLLTFRPEPEQQARRIVRMQLHVVLPAKAGIIAVVLYYIFTTAWTDEAPSAHDVALDFLKRYFVVYSICNIGIGAFFVYWRRFPPWLFQWLVFTLGLLDGLFVAGLVMITDGFASVAYGLFPVLIVLNAISIPLATPQIVLNLLLGLFYLGGGFLYSKVPLAVVQTPALSHNRTSTSSVPLVVTNDGIVRTNYLLPTTNVIAAVAGTNRTARTNFTWLQALPSQQEEIASDPNIPKFLVLWLLTACCYGAQVLRRTIEESREFAVREGQLLYAGRLSAEFAHQIKNPLAIINNAVFSLQRAIKEGRDGSKQLEIIREEVERSDKIITQIMGYAQLSEGHVERLDLVDEVDSAIEQTFPAGMETNVRIERRYAPHLPPLLMQRQHLSQILVNVLQNAREALNGKGRVTVSVVWLSDQSVEITIADTGPGIPPEKVEKVFEQYYSTKEKGTGLGLAIVKHNVELYAGKIRAESELGNGARFILTFPAKTVINPL